MAITAEAMTEEQVRKLVMEIIEAGKKGKLAPSRQEIFDALKALPDEVERDYEKTVVDYSLLWDDETVIKGTLRQLIDLVKGPQTLSLEEEKVAFAAFSVAVNYERRQKNFSAEKKWLHDYGAYFGGHVFFKHMELLSKMEEMENMEDVEDLSDKNARRRKEELAFQVKKILTLAEENSINLTGNVGGLHAFAETVALAFENTPILMQELEENKRAADRARGDKSPQECGWINSGLRAAESAIEKKEYPKFHCTYGRLLAITGDYEAALNQIKEAIDTEDNQKSDYSIRIGQYLAHRQLILARKRMAGSENALDSRLNETMIQYERKLEEQEKQTIVKNMEFLGLFSGIVSFTIGSLTIGGAIAEQSIKNAAGLIVVLMGALMAVFAAFGIILHGVWGKKALRNVFVLLLGVAIVVGGILFCLS